MSIRHLNEDWTAPTNEDESCGQPRSSMAGPGISTVSGNYVDHFDLDPPIGKSLEEPPELLRAAARPIAYGARQLNGLTEAEATNFADALAN